MFCSQCEKKIPDDSIFCPECGNKITDIPNQNNQERKIIRNKSKKKTIFILLALILIVVIILRLTAVEETKRDIQISNEQYEEPDGTVWSTDYLFWYAGDLDKNINKYIKEAKKILEKSKGMKADTYLKANDGLFGNGAYEITSEQTEYCYSGKVKNNQPSGFGILYKYYSMDTNIETYIPIYMGNFKNGEYSGSGISFYDYSEDSNIVSSIAYTFNLNEHNLQEIIDQYFQSIEYIGEFKNGKENGDGVSFEYPMLNTYAYANNDLDPSVLDVKNITAYEGKYEEGKMDGEGKVYYHQKLLFQGNFKDGLMNGKGTSYYPDSGQKKYVGEWQDNLYEGKGTLYTENGEIQYKGKWSRGDYSK